MYKFLCLLLFISPKILLAQDVWDLKDQNNITRATYTVTNQLQVNTIQTSTITVVNGGIIVNGITVVSSSGVVAGAGGSNGSASLTGGSTNYIPVWTSSSSIGNSNLYMSGSDIGMGIINPQSPIDISLINSSSTYPVVFSNGMDASLVLGQPNFTSNVATTTQSGLSSPYAVTDGSGNLWVVDGQENGNCNPCPNNNRVLEFVPPFYNGMNASLVLGQPNFTSNASTTSQSGLNSPTGISIDSSGDVWVADSTNNRVLEFQAPLSNGMPASLVLGQPNFISNSSATTQSGMYNPHSTFVDSNGNIWVGDGNNNRILEFQVPLSSGMNASIVLGQPNFTSNTPATTQSGVDAVPRVYVDSSGNVWADDAKNNRVLEYASPISSGMNANIVLGQSNFTSSASATTQSGFSQPIDVSEDSSGDIWVADAKNNRVMRFSVPISSGMSASLVLGQSNFTSNTASLSQSGFNSAFGVFVDNLDNIWVSDSGNARILEFPSSISYSSNSLHASGSIATDSGLFSPSATITSNITAASLEVSGDITAGNFIGNGAGLTGISVGGLSGGVANDIPIWTSGTTLSTSPISFVPSQSSLYANSEFTIEGGIQDNAQLIVNGGTVINADLEINNGGYLGINVAGAPNNYIQIPNLIDFGPSTTNTFLGVGTPNDASGSANTALGYNSLLSLTTGYQNIGIGMYALLKTSYGYDNIGIGFDAGDGNMDGFNNTFIGNDVDAGNTLSSQIGNIIISGYSNDPNVSYGNISFNTFIGADINQYTPGTFTGNNNILVGNSISAISLSVNNELNIGNMLYGDSASGDVGIDTYTLSGLFVVGNGTMTILSNGNVGIGTTSPLTSLEINGINGNGVKPSSAYTTAQLTADIPIEVGIIVFDSSKNEICMSTGTTAGSYGCATFTGAP